MKKGLLFILMVGVSVCLSAQEKGKIESKAYIVKTNRFGANWFISGGVGGQMYFSDNDGKADSGKRIAPTLDIAVGKWFTPGTGLRVAYNGLQAKRAAPSTSDLYIKGGKYSNGYHKQKWNMANFHGNALFSLSNIFCGYSESRLYSFIPYVGASVALSWSEPHQRNLGTNAGLINRFHVSGTWDIGLELRGLLMRNVFGRTSKEGMAGIAVSAAYKFRKRGFSVIPTVPMAPGNQLDDVRSGLNSLKGKNESLKRDLVEAHNKKPKVIVKKEGGFVPRLIVVFNIGKSNVSEREYMNIEATAKGIKASPRRTFTVTGYANKDTSSAEYNMKLSKKGTEAVCDLMVNKFGAPASQLKVDYKGGIGNMFYDNTKLSRVAITEE